MKDISFMMKRHCHEYPENDDEKTLPGSLPKMKDISYMTLP